MDTDSKFATHDPLTPQRALACAVAVLLLWLVTRPYFGIVQDARFYVLEALRARDPATFAHDLYFQFGSQGSFSIFPKLYAPLLPLFGVGGSAIILTVIGQVLWLVGLYRLARMLAGPRVMWLSVAMVVGVLGLYAPYFSYGEAFVTPRLYAEALTMLALSLLPSRVVWAFVLLMLAAALHPLMAAPGLAVAFVWLALGRPIWWAVGAAGVAAAAGLGLAGIAPFSHLFRSMDPAWFAVVKLREIQCFLTTWPRDAFFQVAQIFAWGLFAFVVCKSHRRFLSAVLLVGAGGLLVTWLGGDVGRNVFVIEIQPWRALWLLEVVTRIYTPLIFITLLSRSSLGGMRLAVILTMALILVSCVTRLARYPNAAEFTGTSFSLETLTLAAVAALLLCSGPINRRIARSATILVLVFIPLAVLRWDSRLPWTRFVESPAPPPADLVALLPSNKSVYWEGSVETLWLRLHRAGYWSCDQGTGAVFNRDTAMTYQSRSNSFWPLRVNDFHMSDACAAFDERPAPDRTQTGLRKLCMREPGLDLLVLSAPLDGVEAKTWKAPVTFSDIHMSDGRYFARVTDRFYIYSCAQMR